MAYTSQNMPANTVVSTSDHAFFANQESGNATISGVSESSLAHPRAVSTDYHLGPDDILEIKIYQLLELEKEEVIEVKVDRNGEINLPVLSHIQVAGMTSRQLQGEIASRLSGHYIRDPKVSVRIKTYGSKQVMVIGFVRQPGAYSLAADTSTLLDVIAMAGGLDMYAGSIVEILRGAYDPLNATMAENPDQLLRHAKNTAREVVTLSQLFADGIKMVNPIIYPGDVISIPGDNEGQIYIYGQVNYPGSRQFRRPMTLLQAMATAGGANNIAAENKCKIIRRLPEGQERMIVIDIIKVRDGKQPNITLARNDTIYVPADPVKKFFHDIDRFLHGGIGAGVDMTYNAGAEMGLNNGYSGRYY